MKIKTKKTICKFAAELLLCLVTSFLFLTVTAPFTDAHFNFGDNNKILISGTTPDPAGAPPSGTPAGTPSPGSEAGLGDKPTTPQPSTTPPPAPTPPPGTTYGPDNPLIPLSKTGYSPDLPQLNVGKDIGIVAMLNQAKDGIFQNLKYILGALAVLYIVLAAVKMIIAGDNEEMIGNQKKAITYGIIGLAVIGFSSELAKVFTVACPAGTPDCMKGGFLSQPAAMIQSAGIFTYEVRIFITFIKYLIGGIAVLMLVRNGIRLVALQGKEESVTLDKKNIAFTSLGLILILLASTMIDKVLYIVDTSRYPVDGVQPAINPERGISELIGITNLIVTFVAPIGVIVLIAGAIMYATAGGKDEQTTKAKRMITMAIIGMILIFGAFAIVSTIVTGQFNP